MDTVLYELHFFTALVLIAFLVAYYKRVGFFIMLRQNWIQWRNNNATAHYLAMINLQAELLENMLDLLEMQRLELEAQRAWHDMRRLG